MSANLTLFGVNIWGTFLPYSIFTLACPLMTKLKPARVKIETNSNQQQLK
jgi:hypothetical protein